MLKNRDNNIGSRELCCGHGFGIAEHSLEVGNSRLVFRGHGQHKFLAKEWKY